MADNQFEIPKAMRDLAEQNMKQAHAAYGQLTDFVTQAMNAWMGAMPANPMAIGFKNVQDHAMEFVTLQTQFAQECMHAFFAQTQQLFSMQQEASPEPERGAMGALPSNSMVTGFKEVQSHVVAMAKENAEVGLRAGRNDRQGTKYSGDFDASDQVRSRSDAGFRRADPGALRSDHRNSAKVSRSLIFSSMQDTYLIAE